MRFEKLRLVGFKSFVEPTDFIIERGLTGVVGPNGCGKSNLVEALRWVMGESSYKSMRASGMDDVIFSGSASRPSRNSAEVSLFLDNTDRTAPAAFNDADQLQVTRRIEREAGSAYKISGKDARAKDVQLLFADQSTGARSPSMVGQGRIGELIQAKPQARRALLEEAAGISGLHSRRHEAELRLRAAETNLERLDDVVSELESQIESLKRQARQAIRFRALSKEIREAEATLLHLKWIKAKAQEAENNSALSQATSAVAERASVQMEAAKAQAIAQKSLPPLREAEASAAATLQRLTIARDQLDAEADRLAARRRDYEGRIAQLDQDIARETSIISENGEIVARLTEEEGVLRQADADSDQQAERLADALRDVQARLGEAEAVLTAVTAEKAEASALRTQLEKRIRETRDRTTRLQSQSETVNRDLEALKARIAGLPDPAARQAALDAAEADTQARETAVMNAETAVGAARQAERDARPGVDSARAVLNSLETEARTLAKLINAGGSDLFPAIIEAVKVDKGYETALGAALGDDLDVPTDAAAPVHWSGAAIGDDDPGLPDGAECLADHVRGGDAMMRRLRQIGVVVDTDTGERLKAHLKPGQRLVSKAGALWRWDGLQAAADAPTAAAMRLAQKNRLAELDAEIVESTKSLRVAEAALAERDAALKTAVAAEKEAREALRKAQNDVRAARDALAEAERAAGDVTRRRAVLDDQAVRLAADLDESRALLAEAEQALAVEPDLGALDQRVEQARVGVAGLRGAFAEARANHDGWAREVETRRNRLAAIARERENWTKRAANAESQIATLRERQDETRRQLEEIASTPDELMARKRAIVREIETADTTRKQAADTLAKAETDARTADRMATDCITALAEAREARARIEERLVAAKQRRADVEARMAETFNTEPHKVFELTGLAADAPLPDMDPLERKLEKLKIDRERLGAVNLRAEEEQVELVERRETITRERDDVVDAIRELRAGIASLNKEGRERLLVAFDDVQAHFTRLFTHLFGGGTAELQLVESEDPLDAGLEIVARPPGKKPQTMTLLSGGEQALTAMALIFAVFLTNPAPICVLDEVDAPLDDHNVERFCDLMDEMTRQTETRFVIITHNPITMARMNRLFGVTMAEQGVSQLVSVDLMEAEQLREAS